MNLNSVLGNFLLLISNRVIAYIPSHTARLFFYRSIMKFDIGRNSCVFMGAWFDTWGNFRVGENSVVNQNCRLDTRGGIRVGNNVSISADVCVLTADHDLLDEHFLGRSNSVIIEKYVFIRH